MKLLGSTARALGLRQCSASRPAKRHFSTSPEGTPGNAEAGPSSLPAAPPARLRFAPSPTGFLHLGGLRTTLFNHLLARKWKGKWIMRIEDTDRTRLVPGAVDSLRNTLEWVGLDYDEGVGAGGSYGPYVQSERLELYHHHVQELLEGDKAYECFCSPDELFAIRTSLHAQGKKQVYDGRCRHLSLEERARRKKAGEKFVVRFKDPTTPLDLPDDLIFGRMASPPDAFPDDFVLLKSDGYPTYHLANVVDDHDMRISHVLRGEEWIPSVRKHHLLYAAFGWKPPLFAHLPLLVNLDGTKLSKRTGDTRVDHYREKGYEPEALLNFLALMGWDHHSADGTTPLEGESVPIRSDSHSLSELFTMPQLIDAFSLENVNHRSAAVNMSKLDFINKMTLRRKAGRLGDDGNLTPASAAGPEARVEHGKMVERVQAYMREEKVLRGNELVKDKAYVGKIFDAELARTVRLNDIAKSSVFFFLDPLYDCDESMEMLRDVNTITYVHSIEKFLTHFEAHQRRNLGTKLSEDAAWEIINATLVALGKGKRSNLLTPLRHALTGRKKGPSIAAVLAILGEERSMKRLEEGLRFVKRTARDGSG